MAAGPYNLVTFTPDADGSVAVALTLEDEWTITAGLKPDINRAICSYREFDKLAGKGARGTIRLWNRSTEVADVVIPGVMMVEVEPVEVGRQVTTPLVWRTMIYRLFFADFRHAFVEPRGGRLHLGDVNPDPKRDPADATPLKTNSELITACLQKLGVAFSAPPAAVDGLPPMRRLKWFGAHAPTELQKLLDYVGAIFVPHFGENLSCGVEMMGSGSLPNIPAEDVLPTLDLSQADRRSRQVIITSAPTAAAVSFTSPDGYGQQESPVWHYVVPDSAGRWWKIDDPAGPLGGIEDVEAEFRRGFPDLEDEAAESVRAWCYRAVQLDREQFDPKLCHLLRKIASHEEPFSRSIVAYARVATASPQGVWKINAQKVASFATDTVEDQNVIKFATLLGKLAGSVATPGTADPMASFRALEHGELEVEFSVEGWDEAAKTKEYFTAGFEAGTEPGSIAQLLPEVVEELLGTSDPDTAIIERPDLRLHRLNWEEQNRDALNAAAELIARQYLFDTTTPYLVRAGRGFVAAELSGQVAEIRYDQQGVRTTFRVNGWWAPSIASLARSGVFTQDLDEAMPQQHRTASDREYLGESGARRPVVPAEMPSPAQTLRMDCLVKLTGDREEPGYYDAVTDPGGQECIAINIMDEPSGKHFAPKGPKFFATLGPFEGDGQDAKRTVYFSFDWHVMRSWRLHPPNPGPEESQFTQGHPTPGYQGEDDWVNIVEYAPCTPTQQ